MAEVETDRIEDDAGPPAPSADANIAAATTESMTEGEGAADPNASEAAAESTYDLLRGRLRTVAKSVAAAAERLNASRSAVFVSAPMTLAEQDRVRTEAACVPRDAVAVGDLLLFGYNIPPGLATSRTVADVFSLYRLVPVSETDWNVEIVGPDEKEWFLADRSFQRDFNEIYRYYADARLIGITVNGDELLMSFGLGSIASDVRVLRWRLRTDGPVYLDAYGERDLGEVPRFDFPWGGAGRERIVDGRWPHANLDDQLFVGVGKGVLEFRIDDAVTGGRTVLSEKVQELEQDIGELRIGFARLGELLLVRLQPYREDEERFYVYNRLTREARRIDAIGRGCHRLPEGHGIVFPGGFYLQNGEHRVFSSDSSGFSLHTSVASPNGEDMLYVYLRRDAGIYQLLSYNVVRREMATPVVCDGYALFPDGLIVTVRDATEAQRVHTIAIYTSPFCTPERYQPPVAGDSFHGRVGNAELVQGIGECLSLGRDAADAPFNAAVYEALVSRSTKLLDAYAWLHERESEGLGDLLVQLRRAAGGVLDEFAAVTAAKKDAAAQVGDAERLVGDVLASMELDKRDVQAYVDLLARVRGLLGRLTMLGEARHVDTARVAELRASVEGASTKLGGQALDFLGQPSALAPLFATLESAEHSGAAQPTAAAIGALIVGVDEVGDRAALLTDVVGGLEVDDVTVKTGTLTRLAELLARRNGVRAALEGRAAALRSTEHAAGFSAAMAVLSQRQTSALMVATDAAACDAALAGLSAELENVELAYGEVPAFADAIGAKRDELSESFARRRDALAAERTARIDRIVVAATRVLDTIVSRASSLADRDAVEGFFAADPLVARVRRSCEELVTAGESGRADELRVALGAARDTARRAVRDRAELFDDGKVKIGKWRFGANTEPFEVRMATRADGGGLEVRLTGTELRIPAAGAGLSGFEDLVGQAYPSETPWLPRALFLAFEAHRQGISDVRALATGALEDGYEIGVHDADATRILQASAHVWESPGMWFDGTTRAVGGMWLASLAARERSELLRRLGAVRVLGVGGARDALIRTHSNAIGMLADETGLSVDPGLVIDYLASFAAHPSVTQTAGDLAVELDRWMRDSGLDGRAASFAELVQWARDRFPHRAPGTAAEVAWRIKEPAVHVVAGVDECVPVTGLMSRHPLIQDGAMAVDVGSLYTSFLRYRAEVLPRFDAFTKARRAELARWRGVLGVDRLRPKVLTTFVRNRLVDEVYLPLIGDNFARQLGLNGAGQGLLLLVSPPGYGKTTLVEYVAELLGFALVKVSGPALGNNVTSLDPGAAPDVASAEELIKLNRALAMGTNVILYLDDVQHTSPELLQKFIPLCDATRRIEGVFEGHAHSFDLSGRRFAVVMAGNPYTSDGTQFRIPDMLANRADVHNLGDVVSGRADAFAESYIEIACGVNEALAPVLARGRDDLTRLIAAADGAPLRSDQLVHPYGGAELTAITRTLSSLARVRDVLMKVNSAYMASAAVDDALRGEPPFLLQGSYRNMARIAQRVLPAMTPAEVDALMADHYKAESQTLATAASWNMAKLAAVLGTPPPVGTEPLDVLRERWRDSNVGSDPLQVMAGALRDIADAMRPRAETG